MVYRYKTKGVCSRAISIDVEGGTVRSVKFEGGCHGNTQGIEALVQGMPAEKVVQLLRHIDCGGRGTSCPDQLAVALEQVLGRSAAEAAAAKATAE